MPNCVPFAQFQISDSEEEGSKDEGHPPHLAVVPATDDEDAADPPARRSMHVDLTQGGKPLHSSASK